MHVLHEVRLAVRSLRRAPLFTAAAVLTLGLGIGASVAIYSVVKRVVMEPMPYPAGDRLVRLYSETTEGTWGLSRAQWVLYREASRTIDELAGYNFSQATIQGSAGPERAGVWLGTASLFRLLGATARAGRLIDESDDDYGAPLVAVLSSGYWQREYGGDPGVIGRTLMLNEQPVEIVGVIEPLAELPEQVPPDLMPDVWLPLQLNLSGQFWNSHMEFRTLARLAPGATPEDASRELAGFNPRLIETFPNAYSRGFIDRYGFRPHAVQLKEAVVGDVARNLWILLAAVGLVLLIAFGNVANLFLVRSETRRREIALRNALGAGRLDVLRHLLAESLVLAGTGALVGVLFAHWLVRWVAAAAPTGIPRLGDADLDAGVVLFAAVLALAAAAALALLAHSHQSAGTGTFSTLTEGGRSATVGRERQRVRGALIVGQVGLALALLVGAGLLLESFQRLRSVDPGVKPDGVLIVSLPYSPRHDSYEKRWAFTQSVLERVRALPGVIEAGVGPIPLSDSYGCTVQAFTDAEVMQRINDAQGTLCAGQSSVSDGYFEALGIPVLTGRALTHADHADPDRGSVVVSRAFAEKFWPGQDVIGKQVAPQGQSEGPYYTIVGVVGDVHESLSEPPAVAIYYPLVPITGSGGLYGAGQIVIRTAGDDPMAYFPAIRAAALEVDPAIPVANPRVMSRIIAESMSGLSFTMVLLGSAAVAALLLAAVGLYGVLGYLVQRRTSEIGVRIALGAQPAQVERMIVGGSLRFVLAGVVLGVALAVAAGRVLESMLFGVAPTQPAAYATAIAVLVGVALAASWIPARRASHVEPVVALRAE